MKNLHQVLNDFNSYASHEDIGSWANGLVLPPQDLKEKLGQFIDSDKSLSQEIKQKLERELFGYGPLQPLFDDKSITEIMVNSFDNIWIERGSEIFRHNENFISEVTFKNFVERILQELGKSIDQNVAAIDDQWRDFRLHLLKSPLVQSSFVLTLRRQSPQNFSIADLSAQSWCKPKELKWLVDQVHAQKNILIVGTTGSGKTTLINALLKLVDPSERIIVIEDTSEIYLASDSGIKILTRQDPHGQLRTYDQAELVKQSLRMRPDRIILGEMRGSEAKDFLLALSTGHRGCMATIHAEDAKQALWRLELLIQMGAPQWSLASIRGLIKLGIDYIVVVNRSGGRRQFQGAYQISSLEDFGFLIHQVEMK